MRLYLKRPNGRRKSYSIYKRTVNPDGSTKNETIDSPELDVLNNNISDLPSDVVLKNVFEIKKNLERKLGIDKGLAIHNEDNERLFAKYWEKYGKRDLIDKDTARYSYERALRALGNLSLLTATQDEIENKVKSYGFSRNKRRVILGKLRLLLRFFGREIEFELPKEEKLSVKYLSEDEFLSKLSRVEDKHLKSLFYTLFYTGLRLGEAFALSELKLRKPQQTIIVDRQIDDDGKLRLPKCEKTRRTFVRMKAFPVIQEWISLKGSFPYSRSVANKRFKQVFGKDLTIHDLRHSYAISLLSKGVSMALVAQSIGNSVKVCEKYYTGFELVDESIELMRRIVGD